MDTGLEALVAIAHFHQLPAEAGQLTHEFGHPGHPFSQTEILCTAKALTLKAKRVSRPVTEIKNTILPAIAKGKKGEFFILARISEAEFSNLNISDENTKVLIHDLRDTSPKTLSVTEFEELWSGDLILLTRRVGLGESLQQVFDISWFIPSLIKYRKLFFEVLIASFFLQLFALVTPLFFQVVMDKVLVHRGFTTLDVLAVGFVVVVVFEAFLGGIRNYLFSHTTNRVDVELGSRLYNHCP